VDGAHHEAQAEQAGVDVEVGLGVAGDARGVVPSVRRHTTTTSTAS
jgi:hypothetical protein